MSLEEWHARQPKRELFIPDEDGGDRADVSVPEETPAPKQLTQRQLNAAAKKAAAALAATGTVLPAGIQLADGTSDIPPAMQTGKTSAHLHDADLDDDEVAEDNDDGEDADDAPVEGQE